MKHLLLAAVLFYSTGIATLNAQTFSDANFSASNIGSGWSEPCGAVFNKTGTKLFVWEKGGKVYVCNWNTTSQTYVKQSTVVLDISPEVGNWRDHGLLGFVLDPNFDVNGYIYLLYVVDRHHLIYYGTGSYSSTTNDYYKATIGRITRYKVITSGGNQVADLTTRTILLGESKSTGFPILHESHGIGSLAFAADGTLLASCGDAASYNTTDAGNLSETYQAQAITDGNIRSNENVGAFKSQMINSLAGKIIRIDPATGNGINSNPFYQSASPRSARSRVWTLGLRNPFRFCVRPNTGATNPAAGDVGELYVGDVGWDKYEELNIIRTAASNCGWPIFEGFNSQSSYASTTTSNKDEANPLYGISGCTQQYFTFQNLIKQATPDNVNTVYNPCNSSTPISSGDSRRHFHRVPVIDWKHGVDSARVKYFDGNTLKVNQIGTVASGVTGTPFQGNAASGSCWYSGNLFPASYKNTYFQADYGGTWLKNFTIQYTDQVTKVTNFATGFAAIVCVTENPLDGSLVVVDLGLGTIKKITYGGNQAPVVVMSSNKTYGASPLLVNFTGSTSYDPGGGAITYSWNFGDPTSGSNTSTSANPSHTFTTSNSSPKKYVVKLTVTDNQGASSVDSIIISANNTPPVVNITSPVKNSTYRLGADTLYQCAATVTDAQHTNGQLKYNWQTFLRHNNHEHPEPIDTSRNTSTRISRIGCNGETYYWFIKLTVTDAAGLSTIDSSKIFPACTGTLPLILHSFSVAAQSNGNLVKWTTESEINLDSFIVERSADGHQFYPINKQTAKSTVGQMQYSFLDDTYLAGFNYYRLRMVDKTTGWYYSLIIKVDNGGARNDKLLVIPNPVVNNFTLGGFFTNSGLIQIRIIDAGGRLIKSYYETVGSGFNNMQVNNLSHLQPGIYFIEVIEKEIIKKTKFIKAQ